MKKSILIALVSTFVLVIGIAKADFVFGEPFNLGPVVNSSFDIHGIYITPDGLSLYFSSNRPGGSGGYDLWVTTRQNNHAEWEQPVNLGTVVNSKYDYWDPCLSPDGLSLYFNDGLGFSLIPGGYGHADLYVSTRSTLSDSWGLPVNLGQPLNTPQGDATAYITPDGLSLYFSSFRSGGSGWGDLWMITRTDADSPWVSPVNLGVSVNTSNGEFSPELSMDGRILIFVRGGQNPSTWDLWYARRDSPDDDWSLAEKLPQPVNTSLLEAWPSLSADGNTLYFCSDRSGGYGLGDIWQMPILPVVDINDDGIVDAEDLCIVVDNWGTDNQLCDIGPMPWGDGTVDVEDLVVIAEHLFEVYPSADTVDVNEADNGGQVELELGKLLVVTLESNPSTGYRWELLENNNSVLKQFGQVEYKSSETSDPPMVGAGGWEIFRFKAVNAGQMILELVYHRSWEDVEPLKTFSIQVVVP